MLWGLLGQSTYFCSFPSLFQAKTGIVMNIVGILCITLAINSWGRLLFDLDTFPAWANATTTV